MIEIRHLRYFVAVAEELNFRRAAERVHIDQTPLARAVRDLEHEMGVRLLVRGPRSLQLTPAGEKLLTEVKRLSIRLEGTKRAVRRTHLLYKEPLRIGVADDIAQPKLSECIRHWRAKFPDVALDVTEMRACELVSALKSENVDVGFSFGIPNDESIVQVPAWHYRLMAALPLGHELADRPVVSLSDVLAFPLLFWNEERFPGLVSQMRGIAERYTRDLSIVAEARTMPGFAIRVASGAVPGLVDGGHVLAFPPSFTQIRPLDCDENVTTFALYKARRVAPSESAKNFLTHIEHLS